MSPSPGDAGGVTPSLRSVESYANATPPARGSRPTTPLSPGTVSFNAANGPQSLSSPSISGSGAHPNVNPNPNSVKAAVSFVKRLNMAAGNGRKPAPLSVPLPQTDADSGGGLASVSPGQPTPVPDGGFASSAHHPVVTETEVIEPAAPGSTVGPPLFDDALELIVAPPSLERSNVVDYAAAAENWLMTDKMLVQYEEFVARGLLMLRNIIRSEPRFAAQASTNWLPLLRDYLSSKYGLIRAAAANALAAFAVSTPGRDAIQKDPQTVQATLQMLVQGIAAGCDNTDTQYAAMALANIAMNYTCKAPLLKHGMLPRAAEVLRVAIRWLEAGGPGGAAGQGAGPGGGSGGGGGGGGGAAAGAAARRGAAPILKAATFMTTLLTCWAVDSTGRQQLQQHGVHQLASELHERCSSALGEDFPLRRRLALLVEATNAIELLEDIVERGPPPGMMGWELAEDGEPVPSHRGSMLGAVLRGVSFVVNNTGRTTMSRTAAAMDNLYRLTGEGTAQQQQQQQQLQVPQGRPGSPSGQQGGSSGGAGSGGGAGPGAGAGGPNGLSAHASMMVRSVSKKPSVSGVPGMPGMSGSNSGPLLPLANASSGGASPVPSGASPGGLAVVTQLSSPRDSFPPAAGRAANANRNMSIRSSHPGSLAALHGPAPVSPTQPQPLGTNHHHNSHLQNHGGHSYSQSQLMGAISPGGAGPGGPGSIGSPAPRHTQFEHVLGTHGSLMAPPPLLPGAAGGAHGGQQHPSGPGGGAGAGAGGSMLGVHFAASIFNEAAAARGLASDDDSSGFGLGHRRSASSSLSPHSPNGQAQGKGVKLPSVMAKQSVGSNDGSGHLGQSSPPGVHTSGSSPMLGRHETHTINPASNPNANANASNHGGRLDLPFHLVRPIPTISASSGKVSRISAAYGHMASHQPHGRQPSHSGSSIAAQSSYQKTYTSDF